MKFVFFYLLFLSKKEVTHLMYGDLSHLIGSEVLRFKICSWEMNIPISQSLISLVLLHVANSLLCCLNWSEPVNHVGILI